MSNSIYQIPHGRAAYKWPKWTDGNTHRAWKGKHFKCSLEAFRRALSTHANRNALRVVTRKLGRRLMAFQFFPIEVT